MVLHHIFNEQDSLNHCPYCRIEIPKAVWSSSFRTLIHYKEFKCNCGKELRIKVDFFGSGHDSWNNPPKEKQRPKVKNLENQVQILEKEKK